MPHNSGEAISDENTESNFADLLESYSFQTTRNIQIGDKVSSQIIAVGKESIFLDLGAQKDGIANKADLLNSKGEFPYNIGDRLELYVISVNEDEFLLSKAISGTMDRNLIQEAFRNRIPVSGKVVESCKGGFQVDIQKNRAFCPVSHMDVSHIENTEHYIGQTFDFLILQFEGNGKNIVVSRRELLKQSVEDKKKQFLEELSVGSVCTGRVSKVMPYGVFSELIPGLTGLIPVSEISWSHIGNPEDVLKVNDTVQAVVTAIHFREDGDPKIALSIKHVQENPWSHIDDHFKTGDRVKGNITRLAHFGAFVEIAPGIEGLVHISEISYIRRVNRVEEILHAGDLVYVLIKEIDKFSKRISLSMKDAEGDPWMDVPDNYKIGQTVDGIIQKREKWGSLVTLAPGIVGILPASQTQSSEYSTVLESFKPGHAITVVIDEIRTEERKIVLRLDSPMDDNWQQYSHEQPVQPLGTFGDKLQEAFKRMNRKL